MKTIRKIVVIVSALLLNAIGANEGYIYCRAEYPLAIKRLNIAINQAKEKGYLGNDVFNIAGFNFDIHIKERAGVS